MMPEMDYFATGPSEAKISSRGQQNVPHSPLNFESVDVLVVGNETSIWTRNFKMNYIFINYDLKRFQNLFTLTSNNLKFVL